MKGIGPGLGALRALLAAAVLAAPAGALLRQAASPRRGELLAQLAEGAPAPGRICSDKEPALKELARVFHRNYSQRVADVFAPLETSAILTVSGGMDRVLINFLLHIQNISLAERRNLTVASALFDQGSVDACRRMQQSAEPSLRLLCIDLVGWMDHPQDGNHYKFWWTKPVVLKAAVEASRHGVLLMDLDVIPYQDPLAYMEKVWAENSRETLLVALQEAGPWYNTGCVFAKPSSLPLIMMWKVENNCQYASTAGDQSALNAIIKANLTTLDINKRQIVMVKRSQIGQQCERGPVATHYNCYQKITAGEEGVLKVQGEWNNVEVVLSRSLNKRDADAE